MKTWWPSWGRHVRRTAPLSEAHVEGSGKNSKNWIWFALSHIWASNLLFPVVWDQHRAVQQISSLLYISHTTVNAFTAIQSGGFTLITHSAFIFTIDKTSQKLQPRTQTGFIISVRNVLALKMDSGDCGASLRLGSFLPLSLSSPPSVALFFSVT